MLHLKIITLLLISAPFSVADDWKETKSQEGNFKAQMPSESRYQANEIETELGKIKIHMFIATSDSGNEAYMLMYNDYPDELFKTKTIDQILADAADGAVENVKGKLQSESKVTHAKFPGKDLEATATADDQVTYISWRLLLVKNRMYQIGCVGVGKKVPAETIKKMKESFELLR